MNHTSNRTKKMISAACAGAFGLAVGAAIAAPRAALAPEPDPDPAVVLAPASVAVPPTDELIVSEPIYIVVDQRPGAAMATGDLPVEAITFTQPTRIQVYRTPQRAVASAEPHAQNDEAQQDLPD